MKKTTIGLLIALATFVAGIGISALRFVPSPFRKETRPAEISAAHVVKAEGDEIDLLRVTCDALPSSQIKAEVVPASPLTDPMHKADYVSPKHVRLTFTGRHSSEPRKTFFPLEISVYPVTAYEQAYAIGGSDYVQSIAGKFEELGRVIDGRGVKPSGEVPYVPTIDASQAFAVRFKRLDFQGGRGVAFLTQYTIETSLVNSEALTYIFQGLTDDGRYYILATFPVSAPGLPSANGSKSHEGFMLNRGYVYTDKLQRRYDVYLSKVARKLEKLPADVFSPKLTDVERVMRSVRVGRSI